jgi:HK97 family phage prohead protease
MNQAVETRQITHEFRVSAEDEAPRITGYAAVFNTASEDQGGWTEIIDPTAFDNVLASNPDVRALWNHNPDHVLGRTTAGTLQLSCDATGLAYVVTPPATSLAKDLMVSMRRKDVTQSSFAFICKRDQWTDNQDGTVTRRILEFDSLLDVSPVTYPAYPAATSQVRTLPASMPAEIRSRILAEPESLRSPGDMHDDDDLCECNCSQCAAGAHGICSADPQCDFATRSVSERDRMNMRLTLLSLN